MSFTSVFWVFVDITAINLIIVISRRTNLRINNRGKKSKTTLCEAKIKPIKHAYIIE